MLAQIKANILKRNISYLVFFLICVFGTGSWVAVNGLWVELPLIVNFAPEGWSLPAYLSVLIQLGNIGPLIYTVGKKFKPNYFVESRYIHGALIIGALACFLFAFLSRLTLKIGGNEHSFSLFIFTFLFATADCSSSVTFLPFVGRFKKEYMTAYFAGQGFSSLIPSLIALVQGVGGSDKVSCTRIAVKNITGNSTHVSPKLEEPLFSPEIFFLILFLIVVLAELSFIALSYLPVAKRERTARRQSTPASRRIEDGRQMTEKGFEDDRQCEGSPLGGKIGSNGLSQDPPELELPAADKDSKSSLVSENVYEECVEDTNQYPVLSMRMILVMLLVQAILSGLSNGVIPSVQSFATLPYGGKEYHLSLTIGAIINPIACFAYEWITVYSSKWILGWTGIYLGLATYIIGIASGSPCPPLQDSGFGSFFIVFICVLAVALVSYLKLAVATLLRNQGQKALLWCGISIQVGSCIGAIAMFLVVSIFKGLKATP